ncbi:hypothetical protein NYO98_06650 [Nocardioides sp. STR2]|uniref:Uncharacterized protein n=1 Tax=Nocardioides pini TaxID=2975053 RepID=A0ABT4CC25_9ACTN|nr:hypothetical protein [Nocardioides pini]MCY4725951.1 hypothetical protein [Nocardioides pini]
MARPGETSKHRPAGIFDVRDRYREQQVADGLAATVPGPVRFAVRAVVTPAGRVEPRDWLLDTRRTLSGLSVFRDRVVEGTRTRVVRTLPPSTTSVELRVSSPRFQARELTFTPGTQQYTQVDLFPGIDYPFAGLSTRPDEPGPTLLRGSVLDEAARGVPDSEVAVAQGLYGYRTVADGAFVVVLPDALPWVSVVVDQVPRDVLDVEVRITLTAGPTWQTATLLADAGGAPSPWTQNGLVLTTTVQALRGDTASVPALRLRLT